MSKLFNSAALPLLVTGVIDVLLFAWMHFTPEGMAFGAMVADWLGMTASVVKAGGLTSSMTAAGVPAITF